jgi:polar amino acid transport system substrate-binding protein
MLLRLILVFCIFITATQVYAQQNNLVIATLEYPPFIYSDENQVKGPIVDKVKDIFGKLGVNVTIKIFPIARGLLMVKNGKVDAYFSLKRTPRREKDLLFTKEPLIKQPFVFFVKKGSKIKWAGDIRDIRKYRFGVVSKTSYGLIFDGYVKDGLISNIDEAQSFELNIKKLIAGRIDLVINSYDVGNYLIKKLDAEDEVIALFPPVEIINSYLAFTKVRDYSYLANRYDSILRKGN